MTPSLQPTEEDAIACAVLNAEPHHGQNSAEDSGHYRRYRCGSVNWISDLRRLEFASDQKTPDVKPPRCLLAPRLFLATSP